MKRLLLSTIALLGLMAVTPAKADIILDTTGLGGTGNNVTFSSVANSSLILGRLNGQNDEVVRFRDLSGNGAFSGAANGNDIKIVNTSDLDITVFDSLNATQLGVTRDIFSIKGDGTLLIRVTALEADGTFKDFNFSQLLTSGQNGFDFKAINGERIWDLDLKVVGGTITDFEHFRIDVQAVPGPIAGVPDISTWTMMIIGFLFVSLFRYRKSRESGTQFRWFSAAPPTAA
jgi:hypothetical protein